MKNFINYMKNFNWELAVALLLGIAFWACVVMMLGGCVKMTYTDAEGNSITYERLLEQEVDEVLLTLPNGAEFLMDGQKSKLPGVVITPAGITIGAKEMP